MTPDQIGINAFLIFTGFSTLFGLLISGKLRWEREVKSVEAQLAEMKADRDWWRLRAERGARMTETANNVLDRVVPSVEP